MARTLKLFVAYLFLLGLAGCADPAAELHYWPRPAMSVVAATQPSDPPPVEAWASILGVRHVDGHAPSSYLVDVRLRLRNNTSRGVILDSSSLELTNGELVPFPAPVGTAPGPVPVRTDASVTVDASFPLPPQRTLDNFDMNSLHLRWLIQFDGRRIAQDVDFQRVMYRVAYYDPYWRYPRYPYSPYPYGFYGGVVIVHRR